MVDRALQDFAEAAMGKNSGMNWSLSGDILRRQIQPIFDRCYAGDLSAESALDVAVDFVSSRTDNTVEIFAELFRTLQTRIDVQIHGQTFPPLIQLEELFLGLNPDSEWATDEKILRRELYPLFVRVAVRRLTADNALTVFCDAITTKNEMYLSLIHSMTRELAMSLRDMPSSTPPDADTDTAERMVNGDE